MANSRKIPRKKLGDPLEGQARVDQVFTDIAYQLATKSHEQASSEALRKGFCAFYGVCRDGKWYRKYLVKLRKSGKIGYSNGIVTLITK